MTSDELILISINYINWLSKTGFIIYPDGELLQPRIYFILFLHVCNYYAQILFD